jgi:hypothetical protein
MQRQRLWRIRQREATRPATNGEVYQIVRACSTVVGDKFWTCVCSSWAIAVAVEFAACGARVARPAENSATRLPTETVNAGAHRAVLPRAMASPKATIIWSARERGRRPFSLNAKTAS